MKETSLHHRGELVSSPTRRRSGLLALAERAQAAGADAHADHALPLPNGDALNVWLPAPLGVALRKADAISKQWPRLSAQGTLVGHAYPLAIAGSLAGSG